MLAVLRSRAYFNAAGQDEIKENSLLFLGWVGMVFYFTQRWIYGFVILSLMEEFSVSRTTPGVVGSSTLEDARLPLSSLVTWVFLSMGVLYYYCFLYYPV